MDRRDFLRVAGLAAAAASLHRAIPAAADSCDPQPPFDPQAWLDERQQGPLATRTPQSDFPLRPIVAENRTTWTAEKSAYVTAFRELIGPWPSRPALTSKILSVHVSDPDFARYKVSYRSLSGDPVASTIKAWLFVPRKRTGPRPAIVCLHQTVLQGKDEPAGINMTLPWMGMARDYAKLGYVTLAPDSIGYGERTRGCHAETGFELADAWPILKSRPYMTLLGLMLFDVTRAVDFLFTRPEVDRSRIGVIGHSMGGVLTNMVLGLERRFKAGVASCGYGIFRSDAYFDRWASATSAYLPRLWLYRVNRNALPIDLLQVLALAAPTAHLVQTAMADTIWTPPAVAYDPFVVRELRRVHDFYASDFVSVEESGDHGWYPDGQAAARELFARALRPDR